MQLEDGSSFKAVHIEARMRLPEPGQGLWPAFWMFPTELTYGKWAASGEVRHANDVAYFVICSTWSSVVNACSSSSSLLGGRLPSVSVPHQNNACWSIIGRSSLSKRVCRLTF